MNISGAPLSPPLLRDTDTAGRFWYWQGRSGRRYIHSVYPLASCPPLPGAIYIAVRRTNGMPAAMKIGRFPAMLDRSSTELLRRRLGALGATELHVHLLAKGEHEAEAIGADLAAALAPRNTEIGLAA